MDFLSSVCVHVSVTFLHFVCVSLSLDTHKSGVEMCCCLMAWRAQQGGRKADDET